MGSAHEDAIDWARLDTQSTKHALRVIDGVSGDLKSFAPFDAFFADVDAIDRAGFGTLVASDTRGQIESMKATVTGGNRNGLFRILKLLRERSSITTIGDQPISQRDEHPVSDGTDGQPNVTQPIEHLCATLP